MRAAACLLVLVFATPALADGVEERVDALLAGYEFVPTAEDWRRVGPQAADVLMRRAADPARDLLDRARSVSSLAHFSTEPVRSFLSALRADATAPDALRRKARAALHTLTPAPGRAPTSPSDPTVTP